MTRGRFITFEGTEGSGKSTQIRLLERHLRSAGFEVDVTREPGGTPMGEAIRQLLFSDAGAQSDARTIALLHTAARAEHVAKRIAPALDRGVHVLCDRFMDSTLAYQGGGSGLPIDQLLSLQTFAVGDCEPDLRILIAIDVETGLSRRLEGSGDVNWVDRAGLERLEHLIGQMLLVGFDGLTAPDYLLDWLATGKVGGAIGLGGTGGTALIAPASVIMTHCNAGALATAGHGTALGVIRDAHAAGCVREVFATETRPWLQGARLTAWELAREGIPVRLVTDGAAAHVMRTQGVSWVIVGADRVAANGDVANKIGTYALAIAARAHGARMMVVAPLSTFDPATPDGDAIHIEERTAEEVTMIGGQRHAPPGVGAYNPVFDVTPAHLIDVLVTEAGIIERPDRARLAMLATGR